MGRAATALLPVGVLAVCVGLAGCGGSGGVDVDGLQGTVRVDGSAETGAYLLEGAKGFEDVNDRVRVTVGTSGGDAGIEELCAGEVDIAGTSEPLSPAGAEVCRKNGRQVVTVPIASDGTVLSVDSDFGVRCLSRDQFDRLSAEDEPRSSLSALGDDPDTGQPLPDAKVEVVQSYSGHLAEGEGGLSLVSIDAGHGCVPPGSETIQDGSYPLAFPLVLYFDAKAKAEKPELAAFLKWLGDHQQQDADAAHVQPLPEGGARPAARVLGAPSAP